MEFTQPIGPHRDLIDQTFLYVDEYTRVVAFVPIELLYSETTESSKSKAKNISSEWEYHHSKHENLPIAKFWPHRNLYRFFIYGTEMPAEYLEWYEKTFSTRNIPALKASDILNKRYNEFVFMQQELSLNGLFYFIENPVPANWNSRGYFNLTDGHHRSVFLLEMGLRFVPVSMERKDYFAWRNDEAAISVQNVIMETNRHDFYTPILNPFYIKLSAYRDNFNKSRLMRVMEAMKNIRLNGKRVLDIGSNMGYMSQHFYREGAHVVCLEPDMFHLQLANELQNLSYSKCEMYQTPFEEYDADQPFDICVLLTVFYHIIRKGSDWDKFIGKLNQYVESLIIWESGDDYVYEKEFIISNTKFKHYKHLSYTYGTGKLRELGIFIIDPHYLDSPTE